MSTLHGVNLAMQTPFRADGSIDFHMVDTLIDQYVDAGVHGLVLGSGTGQHPYLTEAECNQLYEMGAKRIAGRCHLICQASALNVDEVIRRSRHAESIGAHGIMVLPPYFEGPSDDDGLFAFYEEVDAAVGIDIVGYNIPQTTGITVSLALLKRLAELPHFNYIKDSSGDLTTHQEYLRTSIQVLNGADPIAVYSFMGGAVGAVWGAANYMPRESVELFQLVQAQRHVEALALWQRMLPSLLLIWEGDYPQKVLYASQLRGYGLGHVRKPLRPLSPEQQAAVREALAPLMA